MQVLTIAGAKGGTAKTTTAITIAAELAAGGLRVMIADCDPQASATIALHKAPVADPRSALEVQLDFDFGTDQSFESDTSAPGGLWLLRGGRTLVTATKSEVRDHLERIRGFVDVMVVDTIPTIGPIVIGAIEAADLIIIPLPPAPLPLSGLFDMLHVVRQFNPDARARALFTLVKSRRSMTREIAAHVGLQTNLLYHTRIPDDAQCERATQSFQPVTVFARRSRAALAYCALADEVRADLGLDRPARTRVEHAGHSLPLFAMEGSNVDR
jgi:chromosome partitioning protein